MATHMLDRSTYWVNGGGVDNPVATGDYRYWWSIYYDTDKANRKTNFTVDYYLQYHFTDYGDSDPYSFIVPSGKSEVYIDGNSIGSISTSMRTIEKGVSKFKVYIGRKTFSIKHSSDGSASFVFYGTGFNRGTSNSTYSTPKDFPSIPSQSKLGEIKNFDIDTGISSIGVTKYVNEYYDVLQISNGGNVFKTINGFKNGDPVTFTETELDNIYTKIPTGDKATFTFKLTTYTNSNKTTTVGTDTKTADGSFTIVLPTVKGAICTDHNTYNANYTGDDTMQTIIKGQSLLKVSIPTSIEAVANTRKATITKYIIEGKEVAYNSNGISVVMIDYDENGNSIDDDKYTEKDYITVYAVDSREKSSLLFTQKFTKYIPYSGLSVNDKTISTVRSEGGVGRQVTLSFEGNWWDGNFGAVDNALEFEVYYRNAEDGYWNDFNEFISGATLGTLDESSFDFSENGKFKYKGPVISKESDAGFDVKLPYDIGVIIYDTVSGYYIATTVEYGEPAIAIYKNKAALGGPYDESLGGTQLWGDIYVNGEPHGSDSSVVDTKRHIVSTHLKSPKTISFTAWNSYIVEFDEGVQIGDKLWLADGGIRIGPGVKYVTVSGSAYYSSGAPNTELRVWCMSYDAEGTAIYSIPCFLKKDSSVNQMLVVPTQIFDVEEGYTIYLVVQTGATADIELVQRGTTLYVEVVE